MAKRKLVDRLPREMVESPFQYLVSWVFIISCFNILFGFGASPTVQTNSGTFLLYYWCLASLIGGPMILWGMRKAARAIKPGSLLNAWRIERLGLILQGSATLILSVIIVTVKGPGAILSSVMYVTLTMAYGVRLLVLNAKERELRHLGDPSNIDGG